ncbi:MCE family protein [Mycolicibacter algericus]|uniref:Mammalian cell entry protein n=1 Tax=Mycolicibacter algericus DSM 45454 TaxID=723879 RepID=A0ABX3RGN9_MYCAL|nr:MCE family protein [Mycolicibacter algericus]OQZ92582.1 mammalian cell entry protein [Mycolicibacter algericus DSM 45454]
MNTHSIRTALSLLLIATLMGALSSCGWRGPNSLPLPGTQGRGTGAFTVKAQLPDVNNIQENSRVRVGDVTVGSVSKIEREEWHALVTMRLNGDVELPANAVATVGQTSLLGSLHIELGPPANVAPQGKLHDGATIPLSSAGTYPSTEQTLTAVSLLLNHGGIGQIQDITTAFSTALSGRENNVRTLIGQLDTYTGHLNDQTSDIIAAADSLDGLMRQLAEDKPVLDKALRTIPDALNVLKQQRLNLVDAADQFSKFSALSADAVDQTKANFINELRDLVPVLDSLANAGPALTRSLSFLADFPWPKETVQNWYRGDYANVTLILDLTLSRLDASFLTGTRFEGNLTELEMQWGRTIGQLPSPYTAVNPLIAPYHFEQGP